MHDASDAAAHIERITGLWAAYADQNQELHGLGPAMKPEGATLLARKETIMHGMEVGLSRTWYLLERNGINYSRNLLAYGVRIGMYRASLHILHPFPR